VGTTILVNSILKILIAKQVRVALFRAYGRGGRFMRQRTTVRVMLLLRRQLIDEYTSLVPSDPFSSRRGPDGQCPVVPRAARRQAKTLSIFL